MNGSIDKLIIIVTSSIAGSFVSLRLVAIIQKHLAIVVKQTLPEKLERLETTNQAKTEIFDTTTINTICYSVFVFFKISDLEK